jgi:hypothetical protein
VVCTYTGWPSVKVWDLVSRKIVAVMKSDKSSPDQCSYLPDGRRLISWGAGLTDKFVRTWDEDSGEMLAALGEHRYRLTACGWSPDGRRIVTATSDDCAVLVWDEATRSVEAKLEGHSSEVVAALYSPDGCWIITGSADRTVRIWSAETGEQAACFVLRSPLSSGFYVRQEGVISTARDGKLFVVGDRGGWLYQLEAKGLKFGAPLVTPVRLYLFSKDRWDDRLTTLCRWCGERSTVSTDVVDAIEGIANNLGLSDERLTSLHIPAEAWLDRRLISACSSCGQPLKFNPFIVDNLRQ